MTARLEAIDAQHPETVALLVGPLVLFAVTDSQLAVTRAQLLAARKTASGVWNVETASGAMKMMPFPAIEDQAYTTYLRAT